MFYSDMIGIFDSGFGGLTVFKEIKRVLPQYSYIYLGDNLMAPYGGRSQEVIYEYAKKAVDFLFKKECALVIMACNSASSEALRKLQREWLLENYPERRILGVIRPVVEEAVKISRFGRIGVVGTKATVESCAYGRELKNLLPGAKVFQNACPLLAPLVEEGWINKTETRMIIKKYLRPLKDKHIDTLILGCTHYPLLMKEFIRIAGKRINVLDAPKIVAEKFADYLKRHTEIEGKIKKNREIKYLTTGSEEQFNKFGGRFFGSEIRAEKIVL